LRSGHELQQAHAAAVADPLGFDDAVGALRRYSLVEASDGAFRIHRLVQAVTRNRLTDESRRMRAEIAVRMVNRAFPISVQEIESWPASARLLPHALAAAGHAEALAVAQVPTAQLL